MQTILIIDPKISIDPSSKSMLQLLHPSLLHQLKDLPVPAQLIINRTEVSILLSTLHLVLTLLLMGLAVESPHRLSRRLRCSQVLLHIALRLLQLLDLELPLLINALLLGQLSLLLCWGLLGGSFRRTTCLGGLRSVLGDELFHC